MKTGTTRIIIEIVIKTKIVIETNIRDKYRDDSYDQIRGRSKEKDYLYYDDNIFDSEIRRVQKILQMMSQEKEMAIGFMLAFS